MIVISKYIEEKMAVSPSNNNMYFQFKLKVW